MNVLLAIIFSFIVLNCSQRLNTIVDDKYYFDYFDDPKFNNEYSNNLIDNFGYYLEFEDEERIINFLDSIMYSKIVFNKLYLDKEGDEEGFIHYAVDISSLAVIKKIIQEGGRNTVNLANRRGITPLHLAVLRGNLDIIECLLYNNADIKHSDNDGVSVFHRAAQSKYQDVVKYLLDKNDALPVSDKVNLFELSTNDGSTLLHWAVLYDSKILLEHLLNNNPDKDFINKRGGRNRLTALELAGNLSRGELIAKLQQYINPSTLIAEK